MSLRWAIPLIIILAIFAGLFVYPQIWDNTVGNFLFKFPSPPFRLGLDLLGGTHLVYEADLAQVNSGDRQASMDGLKDVIERRVNFFGVSEPVVAVNRAGDKWRLIVELAGIKDISSKLLSRSRNKLNIAQATIEALKKLKVKS